MTDVSGILPLSMRATRLSEMIGIPKIISAIRKQVARSVPPAWMFTGPSGCGKTTLARIVAVSLQCQHQKEWGDPCDGCIEASKQGRFSIIEINASEVKGVEEIGELAQSSRYLPIPPSRYRVYILDEAQMLTVNSQNLLLKYFEDAPATTVWIVSTTNPSKILPTLRRRCMIYEIPPLPIESREQLIQKAAQRIGLKRPLDPLIMAALQAGLATPGWLLMAVEKYASGLSAEAATAIGEGNQVTVERICRAAASGDWEGLKKEYLNVLPEEARFVRTSVIRYLRGCLVRESSVPRQKLWAKSLEDLTSPAPQEDFMLQEWLLAMLWKICRRMRGKAK